MNENEGKAMKKILMIGTGGTIASVPTEDGLVPETTGEELFGTVPEVRKICEVDCIEVFSLDSANAEPAHWIEIAEMIRANYNKYDGFVVTHGTDTLAYTAAGLSYLIQNSPKSIVLTGSQIAMGNNGSDVQQNLIDSFIYACDDNSCGVQIVFAGIVIEGTRARKNYSKRLEAFGSINGPDIAGIHEGRITRYITQDKSGPVRFYNRLNPNVGLVKLVPGMRGDVLRFMIDAHDGVVIEGYGVGNIPEYNEFTDIIRDAAARGKRIIVSTQVPNEGTDMNVYRVGRTIKEIEGIEEGRDMTPETAVVRLMWEMANKEG